MMTNPNEPIVEDDADLDGDDDSDDEDYEDFEDDDLDDEGEDAEGEAKVDLPPTEPNHGIPSDPPSPSFQDELASVLNQHRLY
jgi:hypothetical protein